MVPVFLLAQICWVSAAPRLDFWGSAGSRVHLPVGQMITEPGHTHIPAANAGNRLEVKTVRWRPELTSSQTLNHLSHLGAQDLHIFTKP